jgi:hypothetical protein
MSVRKDRLLADAQAAGYRVNHLHDGTVTVLKGVRSPSGLIIYPGGTAFLADVRLDVAKGIRSYEVMRRLLGLPKDKPSA